ncbi:MAG: hypothetical protein JXD23_10570 [Spirochaetales bacterium]|nr:hypothetical protein [Spirochaetales bacterium]
MKNNRQKAFAVLLLPFLLVPIFPSCQGESNTRNELKTELLSRLAADPEDAVAMEHLLFVELVDLNLVDSVIGRYEANRKLLQQRPMARIYYATALCREAGNSDSPNEKLRYVRKGIGEFDSLIADFPEEGRAYLWQAITYSNFPEILGVDGIVLEDVKKVNAKAATGTWKFEKEELRLLSLSLINLAREFKNAEYLALAREQVKRDGFEADQGLAEELKNAEKVVR